MEVDSCVQMSMMMMAMLLLLLLLLMMMTTTACYSITSRENDTHGDPQEEPHHKRNRAYSAAFCVSASKATIGCVTCLQTSGDMVVHRNLVIG